MERCGSAALDYRRLEFLRAEAAPPHAGLEARGPKGASIPHLCAIVDAAEGAKKRGPYKKNAA